MPAPNSVLGTLKPMGGGDPIPLLKAELVVGRRASCDICLDFSNISGKHCVLRFSNNVWHVRDLGSTNGTTVNGAGIASDHSVMPDDELGIAGHLYNLDYEPAGPDSIMNKHILDEDITESRRRHSLMELAGLDTDGNKPRPRQTKAPEAIERLSVDEAEFEDAIPDNVRSESPPLVQTSDDDFFRMIQEDVDKGS